MARRERSAVHAINKLYFDVRLNAEDGALHYSRADCRPADTAAPFVVRITPVDAADLQPDGANAGYNRYDFSFDQAGGVIDAAGRCALEYQLPEYEIARITTGQYIPETGQLLWSALLTLAPGVAAAPTVGDALAFAVERTADGVLRYSRDDCLPLHFAAYFFLHITPVAAADLSPHRAAHGFNNYDFPGFSPDESRNAGAGGGRCTVERELPDYDIASIRTGQYQINTGRRLWETRLDLAGP